VQAYLLFLLPNLLLTAAILFAARRCRGACCRRIIARHRAVDRLSFAIELRRRSVQNRGVAARSTRSAAASLEDLTRYWTPGEQNAS
jgi:hypothetical protein